jgi:DamX protein
MKNIKLLIVTFLFSSFLTGCGMKGPLYQSSKNNTAQPVIETKTAQPVVESEAAQLAIEDEPITGSLSTTEYSVKEAQDNPQVIADTKSEPNMVELSKPKKAQNIQTPGNLFTPSAQLFAIPATHFTVQLAAMNSEQSLHDFAKEHNLPQKGVYIYQTTKNNKPRYVVIFGEYNSHQSAKIASEALPGSFANMDSWIKKYQLVHQDLLLNNR